MNTSPSIRPLSPPSIVAGILMLALCIVVGAALALALGGCAIGQGPSAEEVGNAKVVLNNQREVAAAALVEAKAKNDPAAEKAANKTLETIGKLEKGLTAATGPDGGLDIGKLPAAAATVLPPPWGLIVGLGGVVLTGVVGEMRRRGAVADTVSLVNGFSSASAIPGTGMRAALDAAEPVLKKEFTPRVLKLVNRHKLKKAD